ncbi:hypothetical protein FHR83_003952 [Actinoplanes campanulatus]|uniref:Uncharacterized protein n=1 Tax=Actinoplanes campanulatus TaxID=113559 RepID=A0A7W5FFF3_9ACTN|nr:ankyrin repeat domain-containing protein [Actinoplanes campanulatus]MBB3096282.1 hypothetical protein [Actinoplanes campanulatus]GGN19431.1 hypothetical protein GCM10010109_32880 [Actinoplanes campanulatus]GID41626.1 hypothetical protein Aca09nite_81320 [Actinoplanes campanulatus]
MLSERDRETAAEAGIVVFANRIITEAEPPIDGETLAAVAARCSGTIPVELVALWRTAFGGRLDYDLDAPVSFSEVFGSHDGYHDLWGWIDHEAELAGSPKLRYLPFGGFEYLDRLYVDTHGGGAVVYWQQGLPPGWELETGDHADALASGLTELFGRLALEEDPWNGGDSGLELRDAIDELGDESPDVAQKLRDLARSTILDWRAALARGEIAAQPRMRRIGLDRAAATGDIDLLDRLAAAGCNVAEPVRNGLTPIDIALANRHLPAVEWLLTRQVPVTNTLRVGAHAADATLARRLAAQGALITPDAFGHVVESEDMDLVTFLAASLQPSEEMRHHGPRLRMQAAQCRIAADQTADETLRHRSTVLRELAERFDPGGR